MTDYRHKRWVSVRSSLPAMVGYALPSMLVWLVYLLAFWPGLMTLGDPVWQWYQLRVGQYFDWHPVFHTWTMWLITRLWFSPAAVALVQIILFSLVVGWGLTILNELGAPAAVTWGLSFIFALSPVNGALSIALWKDIPYSIALLVLALITVKIIISDGIWLTKPRHWILLGAILSLVTLYRHNGLAPAVATVLALLVAYRRHRLPLTVGLGLAIFIRWGVTGPLYDLAQVHRDSKLNACALFVHHIGAYIVAEVDISQADRDYLNRIRPLEDNWRYNCYSIDDTIWDGKIDYAPISEHPDRFIQIYLSLITQQPSVLLNHLACSSTLVWHVTRPSGGYLFTTGMYVEDGKIRTIFPNDSGLVEGSKLPKVQRFLFKLIAVTAEPKWSWLVWRPALYLYATLICVAGIAVYTKDVHWLLVVIPVIVQSVMMILLIPAQHVRYQYPVYLISLFSLGLPFARNCYLEAPNSPTCGGQP
jgi:hypothetical protein